MNNQEKNYCFCFSCRHNSKLNTYPIDATNPHLPHSLSEPRIILETPIGAIPHQPYRRALSDPSSPTLTPSIFKGTHQKFILECPCLRRQGFRLYFDDVRGPNPSPLASNFSDIGSSDCAICHDGFVEVFARGLPCRHYFHDSCISRWFEKNGTCPSCRSPVPGERDNSRFAAPPLRRAASNPELSRFPDTGGSLQRAGSDPIPRLISPSPPPENPKPSHPSPSKFLKHKCPGCGKASELYISGGILCCRVLKK